MKRKMKMKNLTKHLHCVHTDDYSNPLICELSIAQKLSKWLEWWFMDLILKFNRLTEWWINDLNNHWRFRLAVPSKWIYVCARVSFVWVFASLWPRCGCDVMRYLWLASWRNWLSFAEEGPILSILLAMRYLPRDLRSSWNAPAPNVCVCLCVCVFVCVCACICACMCACMC